MLNKSDYNAFTEKMDKSVAFLEETLAEIRAGRANPAVLNKITIEYYGAETPITQVGNITVPEARLLVFTPWDTKALKDVEKAIQMSDVGINPNNDGKCLKLVFPPLTEERRKELGKQVKKEGEDAKVAVRTIRRDAVDFFKKQQKKGEITEDDEKQAEKEIQNFTDKHIEQIDKLCAKKDKELMEI